MFHRATSEQELIEVYGVHEVDGRRALLRAIQSAREEDESDTDSMVSWISIDSLVFQKGSYIEQNQKNWALLFEDVNINSVMRRILLFI